MKEKLNIYKVFLEKEFGQSKLTKDLYESFQIFTNSETIINNYKEQILIPTLGNAKTTQRIVENLENILYGIDKHKEIMDIPLVEFNLTVRAIQSLGKLEIKYFGELAQLGKNSSLLKKMRPITQKELKELLHSQGLDFDSIPNYVRPEKR